MVVYLYEFCRIKKSRVAEPVSCCCVEEDGKGGADGFIADRRILRTEERKVV